MIDMLGDEWSNAMIVDDFSLVRRAFTEFYLTGDIDREIVLNKSIKFMKILQINRIKLIFN